MENGCLGEAETEFQSLPEGLPKEIYYCLFCNKNDTHGLKSKFKK